MNKLKNEMQKMNFGVVSIAVTIELQNVTDCLCNKRRANITIIVIRIMRDDESNGGCNSSKRSKIKV